MDDSDENQIPSRVRGDQGRCVICRLSDKVRSWLASNRELWVSGIDERDFQQTTSETTGFIPESVQHTSDFSSSLIVRTQPNLTRWTRQIWKFLGDYRKQLRVATTYCIWIVYGYIFLNLTFSLLDALNTSDTWDTIEGGFLILVLMSLVTVLSLAFPVLLDRLPVLLDKLESGVRRRQRAEDPTTLELPVEKPPLYETLVFTPPESAMSSLPPPSYEVAIQTTEVPQILLPQCSSRNANIAVPLCPVHQ